MALEGQPPVLPGRARAELLGRGREGSHSEERKRKRVLIQLVVFCVFDALIVDGVGPKVV